MIIKQQTKKPPISGGFFCYSQNIIV